VQEDHHPSRIPLHRSLLSHVFESQPPHGAHKDRRFIAAGVGEDRLAIGREQLRYEVSEGGGVLTLVEDIRSENQVEGPETPYVGFTPVEVYRIRFQFKVRASIVGREIEGCLVMVSREYSCAAGERKDGGQPDAAPELDGTGTRKVAF
jgi:hypothetical protein